MRVARFALSDGQPDQCVFHCQQSVEKTLKALLIEKSPQGVARRVHDLVSLAEELELDLSDAEIGLLRLLSDQYLPARYGDEEINSDVDIQQILDETERIVSWLEQQLS